MPFIPELPSPHRQRRPVVTWYPSLLVPPLVSHVPTTLLISSALLSQAAYGRELRVFS